MVKANCKPFKRGQIVGGKRLCSHILESRHSLPLQNIGCQRKKKSLEKKCSSLTTTRNPSVQTFLIPDERYSRVRHMILPCASEPERDVTAPPKVPAKYSKDISKKQRELSALQTKLIKQQNEFIKLYAQLREFEVNSGKDSKDLRDSTGDVRLVSVKGWPAHDLLLLVRDEATIYKHAEVNGVIGPEILHGLNSELSTIPAEFLAMGTDLTAQRLKILDYFREKRTERNFYNSIEWKKKNAEFDAETKRLKCLVTGRANHIEAKIIHCLHIAKISWIDRESVIHQVERLQQMLYDRDPEDTGIVEKLTKENQKLTEELDRERTARAALSDVVATADGMMSAARARSTGFERQLRTVHAELAAAKRQLESLKLYHARRESNCYARIKKLENDAKASEETIQSLNHQRDALEIRVRELQEQSSAILRNAEKSEDQLKSHVETLKLELDEQQRQRKTAEAQIMSVEKRLKDLQDQYNILRERSRELIALQRSNCLDFLPKKEVHPTEKEMEIWNDLQATQEALARVRTELDRSRADKDGLLESLARIAREGPENRLAKELIMKDQKIFKMRQIIEQKKENERRMEQSVTRYEDQLAALRLEMNMLRNQRPQDLERGISNFQTPQEEEVFTLCRRVETLNRERAALVSAVASRALMLERHERCAELFAQITRTRRQIAAQIEDRWPDSAREGPSNIKISSPVSSASIDLTWASSQSERGRPQPLAPLESPVLEQIIQKRTAYLEQEISQQYKQELGPRNTNGETQLFSDINVS